MTRAGLPTSFDAAGGASRGIAVSMAVGASPVAAPMGGSSYPVTGVASTSLGQCPVLLLSIGPSSQSLGFSKHSAALYGFAFAFLTQVIRPTLSSSECGFFGLRFVI